MSPWPQQLEPFGKVWHSLLCHGPCFLPRGVLCTCGKQLEFSTFLLPPRCSGASLCWLLMDQSSFERSSCRLSRGSRKAASSCRCQLRPMPDSPSPKPLVEASAEERSCPLEPGAHQH